MYLITIHTHLASDGFTAIFDDLKDCRKYFIEAIKADGIDKPEICHYTVNRKIQTMHAKISGDITHTALIFKIEYFKLEVI